jgi:hypothetical protein
MAVVERRRTRRAKAFVAQHSCPSPRATARRPSSRAIGKRSMACWNAFARDIFCRHVRVDVASLVLNGCARTALRSALADLRPQAASVPFQSTLTGERIDDAPMRATGCAICGNQYSLPARFVSCCSRDYTVHRNEPHQFCCPRFRAGGGIRARRRALNQHVLAVGSLHRERAARAILHRGAL